MTGYVSRDWIRDRYLRLRAAGLRLIPAERGCEVPHHPGSILILSQRRLGDLTLEIPALHQLRRCRPGARLGIVAPCSFHPLLLVACRPDCLYDFPAGWGAASRLSRQLAREQWEVAIDLSTDYPLLPAWLARNSRARVRIGFGGHGKDRLYHRHMPAGTKPHMMWQFGRFLELFGENFDGRLPALEIRESPAPLPPAKEGAWRVALHPGATHWTQRWPPSFFAELADRISVEGDSCVVLGQAAERDLIREVTRASRTGLRYACCERGVLELAATLQACDLLVCNNSGPMHLAAQLGVRTLSVMGPTRHELWHPLGDRAVVVRKNELPCIGCSRGYCRIGTHDCLRDLRPEQLFEVYRRIRNDRQRDRADA